MNKTKHIVFLTPGFPKNESDENCIPILQNYIKHFALSNPDWKISVITFHYPFFQKKYNWHGISVYAIGGKNKKGFSRFTTWLKVGLKLMQLKVEQPINVVHSFWLAECAYTAMLFRFIHKAKIVATILGQDCLPSNNYLRRINFDLMTVVASSDFAAKKFNTSTGRNADATIPIGLDVESFINPIESLPSIDILGVGNLIAVKNFSLFIEVMNEIVKFNPNLKSVIVGEGVEYELLQKKIIENNLQQNIELKNALPRREVIELMHHSKLFLHTSSHEGQGYVFAEALYAGMTVVAFEVGNLFEHKRIIVCKNKMKMIEEIEKLLTIQSLNRKRFLLCDMKETIHNYLKIYNS